MLSRLILFCNKTQNIVPLGKMEHNTKRIKKAMSSKVYKDINKEQMIAL